jgi:hypothetical protein
MGLRPMSTASQTADPTHPPAIPTPDGDAAPSASPSPRRHTAMRWVERGFMAIALAWACYYTLQFVWIALSTVDYPYQLEWMEGGVVETVERLLNGQSIYGPPTLEYVPYIYTPLYFVASAATSLVMGVDFFACRLVSLFSIAIVAILIFKFLWHETRSWPWAVVGVGLLFATFDASGRWYHLARVDSMYLALLLGGFYVLRFRNSVRSGVAVAILLWLAFLTKQSAVVAAAPVLLIALFFNWRRALIAGGLFLALSALSVLLLDLWTDGWFTYYTFEVPRRHATVESMYRDFWRVDLWKVALIAGGALMGIGLWVGRRPRSGLLYLGIAAGMIGSAWASRLHSGGWYNVLIPAYAALALLAPLGFQAIAANAAPDERRQLGGSPTVIGLVLVVVIQFAMVAYPTGRAMPAADAQEKGDQFLAYLAAVEGDVLLPDHRWIQTHADKKSYGLGMAGRDILRVSDPNDRGRKLLEAELREAFKSKRFAQVILSEAKKYNYLGRFMNRYYKQVRVTGLAPRPVTGWAIKPEYIWVPK